MITKPLFRRVCYRMESVVVRIQLLRLTLWSAIVVISLAWLIEEIKQID